MITTKVVLVRAIASAVRKAIQRARMMARVLRVRQRRPPTVCILDDGGRVLAVLAVVGADLIAGRRLRVSCRGRVKRAGVAHATVVDDTSGALAPLLLKADALDLLGLAWDVIMAAPGDDALATLEVEVPAIGPDDPVELGLLADLHRGFARGLPAPVPVTTPETPP